MPWSTFAVLAVSANFLYQVIRKPTELFFPVSGTLYKSPTETWDAYATIFRRHSTAGHDAGVPGGAGAGGGVGQSHRAHLLALDVANRAVRDVPARVERGRHVSDHRWHLRRIEALLHPRSSRRRRWPLGRLEIVLVQLGVLPRRAQSCGGNDFSLSRPRRRGRTEAASHSIGHCEAEAEPGDAHAFVRSRGGESVRAAPISPRARPALRRSQRCRISQRGSTRCGRSSRDSKPGTTRRTSCASSRRCSSTTR